MHRATMMTMYQYNNGDHHFIAESHHQEDNEEVRKVIEALQVMEQNGSGGLGCESTEAERKAALLQLIRLIRDGSTLAVMENFK